MTPSDQPPRYYFVSGGLLYQPVQVRYAQEQAQVLAQSGPERFALLRPVLIPSVALGPGRLALARDTIDGVIVRHGEAASVHAWLERLRLGARAATAKTIEIKEFSRTPIGIDAMNLWLAEASLGGRILWGSGPCEKGIDPLR